MAQENTTTQGAPGAALAPVALQKLVLAVFLVYCVLPAIWIIMAMTKDNGQILSTFGLWFASPSHFFENLHGLFTHENGIFLRWFCNSVIYAGSITIGSTLICALGGYAFSKYSFPPRSFSSTSFSARSWCPRRLWCCRSS